MGNLPKPPSSRTGHTDGTWQNTAVVEGHIPRRSSFFFKFWKLRLRKNYDLQHVYGSGLGVLGFEVFHKSYTLTVFDPDHTKLEKPEGAVRLHARLVEDPKPYLAPQGTTSPVFLIMTSYMCIYIYIYTIIYFYIHTCEHKLLYNKVL